MTTTFTVTLELQHLLHTVCGAKLIPLPQCLLVCHLHLAEVDILGADRDQLQDLSTVGVDDLNVDAG